jgi:hypothetical protein
MQMNTAENDDGSWIPITVPDMAEANVLDYIPETNEVLFRTTTASGGMPANTTFSIPATNIKELEKYPITLPNGKQGTLKDVVPKGPIAPSTKKLPVNWSKPVTTPYIPGSATVPKKK